MHDRLEKMRENTEMEASLYKVLEEEASKEYLYMPDLLQEMGRNIVFEESPINAGGRSRLWSLEDIDLVLRENKGTKHVQSIVLETQEGFEANWDPECFSKMINLRLLDLSKVRLLKELKSLPTALKFLRWDEYAWNCLPSIKKLWNLESLQLRNSKIGRLWDENPVLNKLRIIDMSGSESLSETPDFSGTPNLEELLLNGCRKLTQVDDSVKGLKKLVKLSLKECVELETLPTQLETDNLQEFILMGCRKLRKLPDLGEVMRSLYFFNVSNTRITQIPSTIRYLINLKILDLWDCHELQSLPADLPPALIVCASNSPKLKDAIAQLNLCASRVPKRHGDLQGPKHIFDALRASERILQWFEQQEYGWGKDTTGELVTITAEIPSNIVADSNEECWGIAICLHLKSLSQVSQSYIVWRFQDQCDPDKTNKMHGILTPYDDHCGVYVGFYPFDKEHCRPHPSRSGATQLHLTLSFLTTNAARDLHDLAIMGCQWRLAIKPEFDEWLEKKAPRSGHGPRNWERGESSRSAAERKGKGKGKIQENGERGESSRSAAERKGKRKVQENESTRRNYQLRSQNVAKSTHGNGKEEKE